MNKHFPFFPSETLRISRRALRSEVFAEMAPEKGMTEYERQRQANIRRNEEMMAAFKIRARAAEFAAASASLKRQKVGSKTYKVDAEKKATEETPVVMRRSLRTRGLPPDSEGLSLGVDDSESTPAASESSGNVPKVNLRFAGPISMGDAYQGFGSDQALKEIIIRIEKSTEIDPVSPVRSGKPMGREGGNVCDSAIVQGIGSSGGISNAKVPESDGAKVIKQEDSFDTKVGTGGNVPFNSNIKRENGVDRDLTMPSLKVEDIVKKEEPDEVADSKEETLAPNPDVKFEVDEGAVVDINHLMLNEKNVARLVRGRITAIKFFPVPDMRVIAVGSQHGNVGLWNMDSPEDDAGIFLYYPHPDHVAGISISEFNPSKMYTACYDGFLRLMDVEKEIFDLAYLSDESIFSLCHQPSYANCLYFAEGRGAIRFWDERTGKSSDSWDLHEDRINTIDFNPRNPSIMATSSSDGTASIWDLRNISKGRLKSVRIVNHKRSVHSAQFSPSGRYLATSSFDNSIGIVSGADFQETAKVYHNNQTGRWLSSFKPVWGWDDTYIFTGNMKRAVDVISPSRKSIIWKLESPYVTAIPCRFATHPFEVGTIAGSTSGGQVYTWTLQQS